MKRSVLAFTFSFFFSLFISPSASALVDMRNANYSESWTDIILTGAGYDLRVKRTYNSRALFNGIFGFGWCSDFETRLEVTPENRIAITECGAGQTMSYYPRDAKPVDPKKSTEMILDAVKKSNPTVSKDRLQALRVQLINDTFSRDQFYRRLNLNGEVEKGKVFYGEGRDNETVVLKGDTYTRTLADGTFQTFNMQGQLIRMNDRNGNFIRIDFKNDRVNSVTDNNGRKLNFNYEPGGKRVYSITGPNKIAATYVFKGEDLIEAKTQWNNTFKYKYDDLHNLTRVDFPDGTHFALTYNQDRDWVTSFKNREGCTEKYDYQEDKKDRMNHYWSDLTKTCDGKVVVQSKFEFFHKSLPNGHRYLHRTVSTRSGDRTETVYHPFFGRPTLVDRNGIKVSYKYNETGDDRGMLSWKGEPGRETEFYYENECKKVSHVVVKLISSERQVASRAASKKPQAPAASKVVRTVRTDFTYEPKKCNLRTAKNSDGVQVTMNYDPQGRISSITDQAKKTVNIKYDEQFGKPGVVTRPGLGSINVKYKADGTIDKVDSKEGPVVAVQVASIFNNLLEVIGPASADLSL